MLTLKQITKDYDSGDQVVRALDGVSLSFRKNEFVSILGPSGCGKTTLLNIIGGLDQYTSGDLVIGGVSTKEYKDADWDAYRNHSIGFVFQSYNLIPHQTVLANVELALTLSGISKKERRVRAIEALRAVGLESQMKKRPNQMSGGQMQRVAIARALVNNPDILLADEPTGALDTQTSVQIMDILREIAKEKLIIMVTHNPELATEYSNRIIRLVDGKVVDDSNPYDGEEAAAGETEATDVEAAAPAPKKKKSKAKMPKNKSMSFFTALSLSLNNLLTKKARTFMTSFAGSIGIIGIALILSVSAGVNNYINAVQRDTLSTYPLSIYRETQDYTALLGAMTQVSADANAEFDPNKIYVDDSMGTMLSAMQATVSNDLGAFKKYLEEHYDEVEDVLSDVQYAYDFKLQIYTGDGKTQISPTTIFDNMGEMFQGVDQMMAMAGGFSVMSQMIDNRELLDEQYELIGENSRWPEKDNEIILVVGQNNRISKLTLYMLGVLPQDELEEIMNDLLENKVYDATPMDPYSLDDFIGMEFSMLTAADFFVQRYDKDGNPITYTVEGDETKYPVWEDVRDSFEFGQEQESFVTQNGKKLVISGIVRPREGVSATSISTPLAYTKGLADDILALNSESEIINQQKATPTHNVLLGVPFTKTEYTRENIGELIAKVNDSTMESLYAWMTKTILNDPQFADQLVINSKESFLRFFALMPTETQTELISSMLGISAQTDPTGKRLENVFNYVNAMMIQTGVTVTQKNLVHLMPVMPLEAVMLILNGAPASEQTLPNGMTIPVPAAEGLIDVCGETAMQAIYDHMSAELPNLTVNEEIFTMLMQSDMIPDEQFGQMVEMLYSLAPNADANYTSVMKTLGDTDEAEPTAIHFYAKDFDGRDVLDAFIKDYNNTLPKEDQLQYSDLVKTMMSSVSTIINAISYVLIAFVAISLVVSSIMIGIITYISVLERTKEIGILRAIGASKRDIRRVFNAETLIVGFVAGAIGILATLGLNILINILLYYFTGIPGLKAALPFVGGVVLVMISMFLTFIAGLFPSGFAARRNPVEALRSE